MADKQYLKIVEDILQNGSYKDDRTETGTISIFGTQSRYNLQEGFPLLTTKKVAIKSVIHELLWFVKGDTNVKYLQDNGVRIWNEWANENGDLGPIYGKQWRSWPTYTEDEFSNFSGEYYIDDPIDQLQNVIDEIKNNPNSRRHIVSAWNVGELNDMALPPCHLLFQFYVNDGKLSLQLYQRSADMFLGVPFNIASYSLLTHMVAHLTGLEVGEFIHTTGDTHIYSNHIEQMKLQITREPRELPQLKINEQKEYKTIEDFEFEDFEIIGYDPHPAIKGKVSV